MIELEEALRIVRDNTPRGNPHDAPADGAAGFVLARDVAAGGAIPLFTSSAMDGFALRSVDAAGASEANPVTLVVRGRIQAGDRPGPRVEPGGAVRIICLASSATSCRTGILRVFFVLDE